MLLFSAIAIFLLGSVFAFLFLRKDNPSNSTDKKTVSTQIPTHKITYSVSACPSDDLEDPFAIGKPQTARIKLQADSPGYAEIKVLLDGSYTLVSTKNFTPPSLEFEIPFTQATGIGFFPWKILFYEGEVGKGILKASQDIGESRCH